MKVLAWVLQGILAALFLAHGFLFVAPPADAVANMNALYPVGFRVFIGVAELLAVVGLILPGLTRIMPWLTILAALGLMIIMGSAAVFHLVRGEFALTGVTTLMFVALGAVVYLRWKVVPFATNRQVQATR